MRAASFLRMTNCNAFAGSFPCPIPWAWKMGSIFDSHPARLSNLGDKIWSLDAVEWKMPPVFDSWPGRGYDLGGHFTLPTTPSIKFGGLFYPSDHPEHQIWGSFSPFRQLGSQIWGVKLDQRPPGRVIWGVKLDQRPPGGAIWGVRLDHRPSGKGNLWGRIRLFTCFTPKIFTHYLIVEWIWTPIFFENKVIDLLDSLSKGARFETRAGREWKQEHRFEVLEAWKWKEAPPPPSSQDRNSGISKFSNG